MRMVRIRGALSRLTRGRVGRYSTAEHYTDGPVAKVVSSDSYSDDAKVRCPLCGWKGRAGEGEVEFYSELFDVSCPRCHKMLLVVGF